MKQLNTNNLFLFFKYIYQTTLGCLLLLGTAVASSSTSWTAGHPPTSGGGKAMPSHGPNVAIGS